MIDFALATCSFVVTASVTVALGAIVIGVGGAFRDRRSWS